MGALGKLRDLLRSSFSGRREPPRRSLRAAKAVALKAAYDAAQTNEHNARYWRNADLLSADAANSAEVRRILRSRARYEALEANSFAKGIVLTLANDLIGRGPVLQMLSADAAANRRIEAAFEAWSKRVHLARKLRTMRVAKAVDGEAFALFITNRRLPDSGVQLDLRLIEADQVATPLLSGFEANRVDGIVFDEHGVPLEYHLLRTHPGDAATAPSLLDFERIAAADMLHIFRADRPGQHRGVPEITTALPLFALLRDYTLAVLHAARSAAKFSAVLETDASAADPNGNTYDPAITPFDVVDIDYDMMTSLPFGWHMRQFQPAQPTTTYEMFRNAILNEIARALHMPFNIAAGNSSGYNYASGRLDHQTYYRAIGVEQCEWEIEVMDRIFGRWFDEAVFVPDLLPENLGPLEALPHQWFWPGPEHVDPQREAGAQATRLAHHTTTLAGEYARVGLDWETQLRQRARELELMAELGIPSGPGQATAPVNDEETEDQQEEAREDA
jgi:lambda family phage portal protein